MDATFFLEVILALIVIAIYSKFRETHFVLFAISLALLIVFQRYLSMYFMEHHLRIRYSEESKLINKISGVIVTIFAVIHIFLNKFRSPGFKKFILYSLAAMTILPLFPFVFRDLFEAIFDPRRGNYTGFSFLVRFIQLSVPIGITFYYVMNELQVFSNGPAGISTNIYCTNCGTRIKADDKFCPSCGKQLNS